MFNSYDKFFEDSLETFVQAVRPPRSIVFACYGAGASLASLPCLTTGSRLVPAVYLLGNIAAVRDFAGMPELSGSDHTDMHHVLRAAVASYHDACECVSVIAAPPEGNKAGLGEQTTISCDAGSWILTPPQLSGETFQLLKQCQGVNHARLAHDRVVSAVTLACLAGLPKEPPGYTLQKAKLAALVD